MEHIQKKKIEMELSREQAIQAQLDKERQNQVNATKMKIEAEKRLDERADMLEEEFQKRKGVVEQVHTQKHKASEAVEANKTQKREVRDQINKEITDALQRKKQEEEIELRKKQELIA